MENVVPVFNVRRGKLLKSPAHAFHHGWCMMPAAILFANEVGSKCTILTDNYCEDAYDLLQNTGLKKLMLAGILLDTQNLNTATTKDTEAARLLSVGSAPNYGNSLYDQLTQEQRDGAFVEALRHNYGKPPNE
ncbi:hypothetical protein Tco_0904893, partial [Tanacetum coccineum]